MAYAAETSVSVEKTRAELETVLRRYGADAFGYMTETGKAMIQFKAKGKYVRFILPLPDPKEQRFHRTPGRHYARTAAEAEREWEQACRSAWRALLLAVKAKLEAVERKISLFEEEFMSFIVLPNGRTMGEEMLPQIEEAYRTATMPTFSLALPAPGDSTR